MCIESRVATIGKLRTRYLTAGGPYEAGSSPALVLLHGGGESASSWRWIMPALAKCYLVLAPDLPGSGDSDLVGSDYEPGFYARFAGDFVEAMEIDKVVVIGHSLGGLAAIQMALEDQGKRVIALVLIDSAGLGRELHPTLRFMTLPGLGEWFTLCASLPLGHFQRLCWRAFGCFADPRSVPVGWYVDQFWMGLRPGLLWDQLSVFRALVDDDGQKDIVLDRLSDLDVPFLLVWGDSDEIIPIAHGRRAIGQIRNGQLTVIPGCGHMPQVERPELLLEAALPFLASVQLASVETGPNPVVTSGVPSGHSNNGRGHSFSYPWGVTLG
jgi:pimeloyl-ACP methyl ester carboxylesterase